MGHAIDNNYLNEAIKQLESAIGLKEKIPNKNFLAPLIIDGNIKESIKGIARQLNLPIEVNIIEVPDDYREQSGAKKYYSTGLAPVDENGKSISGITAQVLIPSDLPFYGSSALINYPITVKIGENCLKYPKAFSMIIAHELSHVLLRSIQHKEMNNEFYTDLTAMMLGFNDLFHEARKIVETTTDHNIFYSTTETTTTKYGYLNEDQFYFAHNKIRELLDKCRLKKQNLIKKAEYAHKLIGSLQKLYRKLGLFLSLLKTVKKQISKEDFALVQMFYQPGYFDNYEILIKTNKAQADHALSHLLNLMHYTDNIGKLEKELDAVIETIKSKISGTRENIKVIGKYLDFVPKIKASFRLLFI